MCKHSARLRPAVSLSVSSVLACLLFATAALAESSPVEQLPAGPLQQKATTACAGCHEARIIVQQRLSKAAWTKEVDKMMKWGAEVDPSDRDALVDYFSANFAPDQSAYVAPNTAQGVSRKGKSKH